MKKLPPSSASTSRSISGSVDQEDIWLYRLSIEIASACERFWQATPARRKIEEKRRKWITKKF